MPLYGKIVVIKKGGGDGTAFPLTAACLFGRKPDCDIRIQLPHVSKEHCRIELNENKKVILTNLSSVNPVRVNGEVLQQSDCLKHGDVITVVDRSFRFECPPAPTPKKRSSIAGKPETLKVLQNQQTATGEKRASEVSTGLHLKDGTNNDNIQRSQDKPMEKEPKEEGNFQTSKAASPFNELYQMIKQTLETPRRRSETKPQTPASRSFSPKSIKKMVGESAMFAEAKSTPKKEEDGSAGTPKSPKSRKSLTAPVSEVTPLLPERAKDAATQPATPAARPSPRVSPRSSARKLKAQEVVAELEAAKEKRMSRKRKSGDEPSEQLKKKRVSFGLNLSPELFDKRMPPDSPLRKGAAPRRSLNLYIPKQSLLKRASVIGLLQEVEVEDPAIAVHSPAKSKTPTPAKKSPKAKTPSPGKTAVKSSPKRKSLPAGVTSPSKDKSVSPKARKSPQTPGKSASPVTPLTVQKTPSKRRSSVVLAAPAAVAMTPAEIPSSSGTQTTVKGRFSVSCISTPSPTAQQQAAPNPAIPEDSLPVTSKLPLRKKSFSRKTPKSALKNAAEVLRRRSGVSRASMKVVGSWADIVKFGQIKPQVIAPAKNCAARQKTKKVVVAKPKTPAKSLRDHVTTGHADSPATIVVGKAHKRIMQPAGAAPRLVHNVAVLKNNLKMDEDLTGLAEIFSTPVTTRWRKSATVVQSATQTPTAALCTSVIEMSVMKTPEETGEMVVSPLSVVYTAMRGEYNSEAVQRLLHSEEEASFTGEVLPLEMSTEDAVDRQCPDLKTAVVTPKQKPSQSDCLTGVKRLLKTPKQKVEPIEDLRGKLLKTPRQKAQQQECLSGVKRLMKTPRQRTEPIEDLHGKLLKTPRQKAQQQECLSGVKRLMKTPRQRNEPIEDLHGKLLKTPKAPKVSEDVGFDGVKELLETPKRFEEPVQVLAEVAVTETPEVETFQMAPEQKGTPVEDMRTPRQEVEPVDDLVEPVDDLVEPVDDLVEPVDDLVEPADDLVEPADDLVEPADDLVEPADDLVEPADDLVGVKRPKTPKQACESVEENSGLKRLMKNPTPRGDAPMEEYEGLAEIMNEPEICYIVQREITQDQHCMLNTERLVETGSDLTKDAAIEEKLEDVTCAQVEDGPSENMEVSQANGATDAASEEKLEDVPCAQVEDGPSENIEDVSCDNMTTEPDVICGDQLEESEQACSEAQHGSVDVMETAPEETVGQSRPEEQSEPQIEAELCPASEEAVGSAPEPTKKTVRGRRAKTIKPVDEAEHVEEAAVTAPVRGKRGRKTETVPPAAVRPTATRSRRGAKPLESKEVEVPEATADSAPAQEAAAQKPRKGRSAKQATVEQVQVIPEIAFEAMNDQPPPADTTEPAADDITVSPEEPCVKRQRGRKRMQVLEQADTIQEEAADVMDHKLPPMEAQAEEHIATITEEKPRRGRKANQQSTKQAEEAEDTVVNYEQPQVPVRAKRGRGKAENAAALEVTEQTAIAEKPRRGRKQTKQEPEVETSPELTEVQDKPTERPKRGRAKKAQAVIEEVPGEEVEHSQAAEEETNDHAESTSILATEPPEAPVKLTLGRRANAAVKDQVAPAAPAKRASRLAAPPLKDAVVEENIAVSWSCAARGRQRKQSRAENVEIPVKIPAEPVKRGRKPAGKQTVPLPVEPTVEELEETAQERVQVKKARGVRKGKSATNSIQENTEDLPAAAEEVAKLAKKSVKWKDNLTVTHELLTATPVLKATRGRKAKLVEREEEAPTAETATSKPAAKRKASRSESKAEEEDLSEKAAPTQPVKRARRGTKEADSAAPQEPETSARAPGRGRACKRVLPVESAQTEVEGQPKTRRGRATKK